MAAASINIVVRRDNTVCAILADKIGTGLDNWQVVGVAHDLGVE